MAVLPSAMPETPIKMIGARLDITSRKKSEAHRYESERFRR